MLKLCNEIIKHRPFSQINSESITPHRSRTVIENRRRTYFYEHIIQFLVHIVSNRVLSHAEPQPALWKTPAKNSTRPDKLINFNGKAWNFLSDETVSLCLQTAILEVPMETYFRHKTLLRFVMWAVSQKRTSPAHHHMSSKGRQTHKQCTDTPGFFIKLS